MRQLTGILRAGVFYEAPAWEPAPEEQEQDVERKNALSARFEGLSERIEQERRKPDESIALGAAVELLAALRLRGNRVELAEGERVRVSGPPIDEQTIGRIREQKQALVRLLSSEQP